MEQLLQKDRTVSKIKTGSLVITVMCVLAGITNSLIGFTSLFIDLGGEAAEGQSALFAALRIRISFVISAVIMLCAAGVFFGIFKTGKPFTHGTVLAVRFIGILFVVNSIIPVAAAAVVSNMEFKNAVALTFNPGMFSSVVEGVLFILIAQVFRYGTLLQQESDETL